MRRETGIRAMGRDDHANGRPVFRQDRRTGHPTHDLLCRSLDPQRTVSDSPDDAVEGRLLERQQPSARLLNTQLRNSQRDRSFGQLLICICLLCKCLIIRRVQHSYVGDRVEAGQVLAKLDPESELNALRSAEAALSAAQGQLTYARGDFERQRQLLANGHTPRARFD